MKVVLTGGGTGGHFYPLIAVAESLREQAEKEHVPEISIYYLAPEPYDEKVLFKYKINFRSIPSGKLRMYPSVKNFTDMFSVISGIIKAFHTIFYLSRRCFFKRWLCECTYSIRGTLIRYSSCYT